jgi:integrase
MEGSVTKRSDGRWQGVVDIPNITGKRIRKYVYARTRAECRKKVNDLIEQIENQSFIGSSKVTFREYAKKWLDTYCQNLSPTTIDGYRKSVLVYADKYIGDALISKILPIHIQEMMNAFSKNHSAKTCKNLLSDISGVFKYAIINKIIKFNPCIGVKIKAQKERYKYSIYTEEQFNELLDKSINTPIEIPVILGGLCGMRLSEIMGLTWNDIDFENHVINIRRANVFVGSKVIEKNTKTNNSYRRIVAPDYVMERLKEYKGVGYVYPKKDGTPEHGGNFRLRFANFLKKHGLPKTRFHDLRHFSATIMLKKGVPDKIAAEMLGHANTSITKRYQHIIDGMDSTPAKVLDSVVRRNRKLDVKLDVK